MPSQRNVQLLQELKDKVARAVALFFVDYQGLTHKKLEEARSLLRPTNAELSVVKNTLMNLALKEKDIKVQDKLQGPNATLFALEEPIKAAKVLYAFFKKYNLPKIKFGVFEGKLIGEQDIVTLATLPTREVLLGKLVGVLKSPITNFVYDLNYTVSKFIYTLKAIGDIKGKMTNS